ncbi:hypothetical protein EK904_011105, partial [Melospiza melodia maxima]
VFKIGFVNLSALQHWNCPNGYRLKPENSACVDIDECLEGGLGTCGQTCINIPGSYICSCLPGYSLGIDKQSCYVNDPAPFLLFSHGNAIFRIDTEGTNHERLVSDTGPSTLMDFHYIEEKVYWVDSERRLLQRINLNGTKRERLCYIDKGISGFAIDWINQDILWANRQKGTIEATDMNGKKRRVLLRAVGRPTRITIDAEQRLLFLSSDGTVSSIYRASLSGSDMINILKTTEKIKAISLDLVDTRLYWIQHDHGKEISHIRSCDYDGGAVRFLRNSVRHQLLGMSLFADHLYYSDLKSGMIWRANKYTGNVLVTISLKPSFFPPVEIKIVHPFKQPGARIDSQDLEKGICDWNREKCRRRICRPDWRTHRKVCIERSNLNGMQRKVIIWEDLSQPRGIAIHPFANVSVHKEIMPMPPPETVLQSTRSTGIFEDADNGKKQKIIFFTAEIMVSDEDDCTALECYANAECVLLEDGAMCQCLKGFTRKGKSCYESTVPPAAISSEYTTKAVQGDVVGCPPSYESYCLHGGVCNYVSDLQDYACNCVTGYVGERCQFSDLEWWEQHRAGRAKVRSIAITAGAAAGLALLLLLLLLAALAALRRRSQNLYKKNLCAEAIRAASSRADNESVTPTGNNSLFAVFKEGNSSLETKAVDLIECETADPHPACPSESEEEQPVTHDKAAETLAEEEREQDHREEGPVGEKSRHSMAAVKSSPQAPWSIHPNPLPEREPCNLAPASLLMQPD